MLERPVNPEGLVEGRWKKFGHDRVYLETPGGTEVGFIDLIKNELIVDLPEYEGAAEASFARWQGDTRSPGIAPVPVEEPMLAAETATSRTSASLRPKAPELPTLTDAKWDSPCTACGSVIRKGDDLFWVPGTKVVVCPPCTAAEVAAGLDRGTPGAAATRIANAKSSKYAQRLLATYPMLGEHLAANARRPSDVRAWIRGVDGERIVGRKLDIAAAKGRCVVLHDRRSPNGGNIDHIVIGTRRICVVDAKHYRNAKVTKRADELRINGQSAEDLIDGVKMQQYAVQDVLIDRPLVADNVSAVLAFVGAKFGFSGIVTHRGVWCSGVKDAVDYAAHRGPVVGRDAMRLSDAERVEVARLLVAAFPAN